MEGREFIWDLKFFANRSRELYFFFFFISIGLEVTE